MPNLSSLSRAVAVGKEAAHAGFDWEHASEALDKVREEVDELSDAMKDGIGVEEELGDLLFAITNVARKLGVDPDVALQDATQKFERRFASVMGQVAKTGRSSTEMSLSELESFWAKAKEAERDELDI